MMESMISILIFSFGVLALFGMQSVALKSMSQSNYRATAVYMISQLVASAQGDIKHLNDYQTTSDKVIAWKAEVTAALPSANVTVVSVEETLHGNGTLSVTVSWLAPGDSDRHQHTVSTYVSY